MTRSTTRPGARAFRHTPIALAILAVCVGLGAIPQHAHAQTAQAVRHYDIPAGPLDQALNRFAAETGILLTIDASLTAGKRSPGLKSETSPAAGLQKLLQGTGLEAVKGDNGWQLRRVPVPISGEATLAPVTVSAGAVRDGTTEGTGSYSSGVTTTATKLPLSPRETPQTVTVVTRQQMDDFAMTTVDDALKSASGVFVFGRGNNGNNYYSRGFEMQYQYDGMPNPIGISNGNRTPLVDNVFLDHMEVLQGASGLLSGAGEPGGTINLVRKHPTQTFQAQAEAQLGSWDRRRVTADLSGPLTESGTVRGRIVALSDDGDSWIDYVYNNKRALYGVVDVDLGATTTLSASIQYQRDEGRNNYGVPMGPDGGDLGLSRSSFFNNAKARTVKEYTLYTLGLEQKLPGDWVLKASYSRNETEVDIGYGSFMTTGGSMNPVTGDGWRISQFRHLIRKFESDSYDVYASGPVTLFGRQHELVFGANGSEMRDASRNSGNTASNVNIYTFDPAALPEPAGVRGTLPTPNETSQNGFFGAGRFNLADSLKLILGSRVSWYEYRTAAGVTTQKEEGVLSPYAGLVYDIDKQYSAYASYSDIFKPQSNLSSSGNPIDPVVGANYEVGIKGEFLGGKLNVAAALFRLEQTNLAKIDDSIPNDPTNICEGYCYLAQDRVVSQGADFSINGEVRSGWSVSAGYTYVGSQYDSGAREGQRYMTTLPQRSLRVASHYHVPGTGWSIGGNVRAQSGIYTAGTNSRVQQGGLALVGLAAKYRIDKQAELNFVIDNLFDRRYFSSIDSLYSTFYGEPRKLTAALKYNF